MPIIDEMYAFCAEEKPGDEGVVGFFTGEGWLPLVGADMARVEELRKIAITSGRRTACSVILKKFKLVSEEVVYEAKPS